MTIDDFDESEFDFDDESDVFSRRGMLCRLSTRSSLIVELLAGMSWHEWLIYTELKFPGWTLVGLYCDEEV